MQTAFDRLVSGEQESTLADLAAIIVREAVRHGGEAEYNIALHIFKNPPTPQHQLAAIAGLTASNDLGLLMRTAGLCMQGEVPAESLPQVFHVSRASSELSVGKECIDVVDYTGPRFESSLEESSVGTCSSSLADARD